jgi:ubiquinol-cytochrome c reductase cytochrome b subunit
LFKQLADWLDDRTGALTWRRQCRERTVPGGAAWRYVSGPVLLTVFLVQVFTGLLLMSAYSPSSSSAWGSVYYINHEMWLGWFIRGVHHFAAQAMVVLLAVHLLQVLVAGAYRRPREFTWWFGVGLLILTVEFGHTGYQLPWDQKGYWATKVVTNIVGGMPGIGPAVQKLLVGGTEYGNQTLTRFFALHVAVLPALFVALLVAHVALVRRKGLTPPVSPEAIARSTTYWPHQSFRNVVASAAVIAVVVGIVLVQGGAHLDAPADPSSADYPARPEWFFLSLYQMLKYFPGNREVIGTVVIPSTLLLLLILLPFFDRVLPRRLAHALSCVYVFAVVGGAGYLTAQALWDDAKNEQFHEARKKADAARDRAMELASLPDAGIPPDGAGYLLRRDPLTQGLAVLERRCLGCHVLEGQGLGEQSAPDLAHYGTRAWIRGLLENPRSPTYFGKVANCDGMDEWKKNSKLDAKQLDAVADFVASFAQIPPDTTIDEWLSAPEVNKHPGLGPFQKECGSCHAIDGFTDGGTRDSTGLFAWGSPAWITRMVRKPGAANRYGFLGEHQKMPAFDPDQLSENDLNMVIRYLRGDYPRTQSVQNPGSASAAPRLTSRPKPSSPTAGGPPPRRL